ncbi:M23 family metallopeptidase [Nocardia brasiliensis]
MSGYGPRGFEQRNTSRLRNPDEFQQGFSYSLRRDEPWASREDRWPTPADRWPTTEDRWSGDDDRWAVSENPRFAAEPWSPENRWPENNWPPGEEQWAEDRPTDDPTPTDQWTWSNDRWQSPNGRRAELAPIAQDLNTDHGPASRVGAERAQPASAEPRKRRGGRHRMPPPPTALKGRAAIVAVAAGAIVAAGQNLETGSGKAPAPSVAPMALGQPQAVEVAAAGSEPHNTDPGLLAEGPATLGQFADMLQNGSKVADEIAADVQAKLRPLFVKFTSGTFTSGYGMRWGTLHPGVDVAAPIGTPIVAVEDGTVISAGPASGFGMWVRVLGDDGTVTVYGHINTALVSVGQHVTAGDEIATVGNRGETTGPHCHFEVWLNGTDRIDPLPWLATRGIGLGPERD